MPDATSMRRCQGKACQGQAYQGRGWGWVPLVIGLLYLMVDTSAAQKSLPRHWDAPSQPNDLITLNIESADIAEVLKFLSLERQVNIVAGKDVTGKVSVNLYNVPFETALRVILQTNGFTFYRQDDVIFVTKAPEQARPDPQLAPLTVQAFRLNYVNITEAFDMVQNLISSKGKVVIGKQSKTLVVQDTPETVEKIAGFLQTLDARPRQVLIEAKILEITLNDATTLGIDWSAAFGRRDAQGQRVGSVLTQGFVTSPTAAGAAGFFFSIIDRDASVVISALRDYGQLNTLASPKILVVDGQEAKIIIGSKLGFRTSTTTQTVTVENVQFLEVGTLLLITPTISPDGYILMNLRPKVSDGRIEAGLPSETTTEAITSVLVRDGATVVLGGLLRERKEELRREVPGLGRVPVLGALFRRNSVTRLKTEIAVLITPQIVREALPTGAIAPQVSKQREGEAPWDADFVLALSNAL